MYKGPEGFLATDVKVIPDVGHSSLLIAYFFSIPLFFSSSFAFILSLSFTLLSYIFITTYLLNPLFSSHVFILIIPTLPFLGFIFSFILSFCLSFSLWPTFPSPFLFFLCLLCSTLSKA